MPLVWAHAEFLKLLYARKEKRPIELLNCVEKHLRDKSANAGPWHWRTETPFVTLPAERDLLIEMQSPFILHIGFDGWNSVEDRPSAPLPFGRHGVCLTRAEVAGRSVLDFTRYFLNEGRWEGVDYHVRCTPAQRADEPNQRWNRSKAERQTTTPGTGRAAAEDSGPGLKVTP